jgi:hypothetical protein
MTATVWTMLRVAAGVALGFLLAWTMRPAAPVAPVNVPQPGPATRVSGPATSAAPVDPPVLAMPVAVVNGVPITLRRLEDALLKKEGAEEVKQWVAERVDKADWERFDDGTPILTVAGSVLTRKDMAVKLLEKGAGNARQDLINQTMVEQAIAASGVVLTQEQLDLEYARMERAFRRELESRRKPIITYANFLRENKGLSVDEFKGQKAFRIGAGLHALVVADARKAVSDRELEQWFEANRARFDVDEAVDLSLIHIAYQKSGVDGNGVEFAVPQDRDNLMAVFRQIYVQIVRNQVSFETAWANFGRAYDRGEDGGRIGWVGRDGRRAQADARQLPPEVMRAAFDDTVKLPRLCLPVEGPDGIDLIRVNAWRPRTPAVFTEQKERIFAAWVEEDLDDRTTRWMHELLRRTTIQYKSIPELTRIRAGE